MQHAFDWLEVVQVSGAQRASSVILEELETTSLYTKSDKRKHSILKMLLFASAQSGKY